MDAMAESQQEGQERTVADDLADRVRDLVAAAEKTAATVRFEAEQEAQNRVRAAQETAQKRLEEAKREVDALQADRLERLGKLDAIIRQAETLVEPLEEAAAMREQLRQAADSLTDAARSVVHDIGPAAGGESPVDVPASGEAGDDGEPSGRRRRRRFLPGRTEDDGDGEAGVDGDEGGVDALHGTHLVALQMALAGGKRGEVGAHLRRAFGLDDPDPILDEIFGPGTDDDRRAVEPDRAGDGSRS